MRLSTSDPGSWYNSRCLQGVRKKIPENCRIFGCVSFLDCNILSRVLSWILCVCLRPEHSMAPSSPLSRDSGLTVAFSRSLPMLPLGSCAASVQIYQGHVLGLWGVPPIVVTLSPCPRTHKPLGRTTTYHSLENPKIVLNLALYLYFSSCTPEMLLHL